MNIELKLVDYDDLEMIRQWRNSPEVASYMYTSDQITTEQQEAWFNRIKDDISSRYWIIIYENTAVGLASVTGISSLFSSCYWAFYLGNTNIRGAGIGAKVEYSVLEYVFNELRMNKLRCEVITSNEKVIQMHEKFGFRREAFYRQHVLKDGKFLDVVGLALLKNEWQIIKENMYNKIYKKL